MYDARPSLKSQWFNLSGAALFFLCSIFFLLIYPLSSIAIFLGSFIFLGIAYYRIISSSFHISNGRIECITGIIFKTSSSLKISDIRTIRSKQGIIERLLDIGSVHIYTSGSDKAEIVFHDIDHPIDVKSMIENLSDR